MHQYKLFDTTTRWQRLSVLIEMAGEILEDLTHRGLEATFQPWFVALKEKASIKQVNLDHSDAEWLWDVLRSEPSVQREFGSLPPAGSSWFQQTEHFDVLNKGECFGVGLRLPDIRDLLNRTDKPPTDEAIVVRLLEKLRMRPGKASRLECYSVLSELIINVEETFDEEREAKIMRVAPQLITMGDKSVTVIAKSLNQAYTMASRRLEPERRGPNGHAYDRLVYLGRNNRLTLETIRRQVETGKWEVPTNSIDP